MRTAAFANSKTKVLLWVVLFCCLNATVALADSIFTQVVTSDNSASGTIVDCKNPVSCGTSQATATLSAGTAGSLAQISSALPNAPGVTLWQALASSVLNYSNTVDVPSSAGSVALTSGSVIFTLTIRGRETNSGSGGYEAGTIGIGANENFVGASGTSLLLPAATSIVQISTPVSAGSSAFSFSLTALATCPGYTAVQFASGDSCTATADFLDPATIKSAAVYGPSGNLISDATIVSQSGYSPQVSTPEPATIFLIAMGMIGIGCLCLAVRERYRIVLKS